MKKIKQLWARKFELVITVSLFAFGVSMILLALGYIDTKDAAKQFGVWASADQWPLYLPFGLILTIVGLFTTTNALFRMEDSDTNTASNIGN